MNSFSDPSDGANPDWRKFDFTKWNLNDLNLDVSSSTLAGLAEQLFASPEWKKHFTATLPAMKEAVHGYFQKRADTLKASAGAYEEELKERTAEAAQERATFQGTLHAAASPPLMKADPNLFQFGARVVDEKTSLGLPGLQVRLIDETQQGKVLAEGVTDPDGNVLLSLSKEQAAQLAERKSEPSVEVVTPEGKPVYRAAQAVCPRPDHTQTLVAAVSTSIDVQPQLDSAVQFRAEREARALELQTKGDRLKHYYEGVQKRLKAQLDETQQILDEIKREASAKKDDPGPFGAPPEPAASRPPASEASVSPGIARPVGSETARGAKPHEPVAVGPSPAVKTPEKAKKSTKSAGPVSPAATPERRVKRKKKS
ncbi:MAG TPA: hypothetical protein VJA21_19975 [Verrucomicrobiae bacterium]